MKPQSCKAKGRRLQQQIVADLLQRFPTLTEDDIRSTSMGAHGEDVQMSSEARRLIPFSFEAKNQEKLNLWDALGQAETNTPDGIVGAVVFKKNGKAPHITLKWTSFLDIISPTQHATEEASSADEIEKIAGRLLQISHDMRGYFASSAT